MNIRAFHSDDEGEDEDDDDPPFLQRNIFTSQKNLRGNQKRPDLNLKDDVNEQFVDRESLKQKIFVLESEKKLLKEHLKNFYDKKGIKEETNLIQFFSTLEENVEKENGKHNGGQFSQLQPVFIKVKNTFLELVYQLEQSMNFIPFTGIDQSNKPQIYLNEMKSIIGLIFGQVLFLMSSEANFDFQLKELETNLDQIESKILAQSAQFKKHPKYQALPKSLRKASTINVEKDELIQD